MKGAFEMSLAETNVVARFIEEACEKVDPDKSKCATSFAYVAFNRWCDFSGLHPRYRPQLNTFGERFEELGYLVKHNKVGSAIYGINIRNEWTIPSHQASCWAPASLGDKRVLPLSL
jgi:hypothetical protein